MPVVVQPFPTLSLQVHILKLGHSFLVKGDETEEAAVVEKGGFSSLDKNTRDEVVNRLKLMHGTFSALSHWTSYFAGMVENSNVLLKPADFQKQFPFGANPTTSMIGGLLAGETETRRKQMQEASGHLIVANPDCLVKKKKVAFFSGTKLIEKLSALGPAEIEAFSESWNVPAPAPAPALAPAPADEEADVSEDD